MRLKLTFTSLKNKIKIPLHYHHLVQAMLYRNLPSDVSDFLHNIGFFYKNRSFKLFSFSKILSKKVEIKNSEIIFDTPVTLYVSSAVNDYPKNWAEFFIKRENIRLGNEQLILESIEVVKPPDFKQPNIIKTLSTITVYRTFTQNNGKKYRQYYFPQNPEFKELLKENIRKKYELITGNELLEFKFSITPIFKPAIRYLKFGEYNVKSVEGSFKINISPDIFGAIYDAGLGVKNSQGFGMVEILS